MKPKLTTRILKYLLIVSAGIAFVYALIWIVLQGYAFSWTGFADFTKPNSDFVRGKSLWDWMELFIIPIFLSVGAFLLNRSERNSERLRSEERSNLEREIATDRQQEAALQAYLDRMADLLLKEKLRTTKNEEARDVARMRTLTVLRGLDKRRKELVLLFLIESGLITQKPIINLTGADLNHVIHIGADLNHAILNNADLTEAVLIGAKLNGAKLSGANLSHVDLINADLNHVDLSYAFLKHADLNGVDLTGANLRCADLSGANLTVTKLIGADLTEANLDRANLTGANLTGAILDRANLYNTILKNATMPDGITHD